MTTCIRCGGSWAPLGASHCPCCHLTFASEAAGDMHRIGGWGEDVGKHGPRRCLTEAEMTAKGMAVNAKGLWVTQAWAPDAAGRLSRRPPGDELPPTHTRVTPPAPESADSVSGGAACPGS